MSFNNTTATMKHVTSEVVTSDNGYHLAITYTRSHTQIVAFSNQTQVLHRLLLIFFLQTLLFKRKSDM